MSLTIDHEPVSRSVAAATGLSAPLYRIIDQDHEMVGHWMHQQGGAAWRAGATCIGLVRNRTLVAATMYDYFNGASIFAHIVIAGPVTRQWLWYIFAYPFVQCQAKTIIAMIPQENRPSQHLVERFGFRLQVGLDDADPSGALFVYLLHRDHCRFIRSPYGKA